MKKDNYYYAITLGCVWLVSLCMLLFAAYVKNNVACKELSIMTAILIGLFLGELRQNEKRAKIFDQFASCSLFLAVAFAIVFLDWALWFIPSIIFIACFLVFALMLAREGSRCQR